MLHAYNYNLKQNENAFMHLLTVQNNSKLVAMELSSIRFTFPTRIISRGVSGFVTGCPYGVQCCGLTICPLNIGPLFGKCILYEFLCKFDIVKNSFPLSCFTFLCIDSIH